MPGISTSGPPRPKSTTFTSVPQGLADLQRVLHPQLRLRLAQQAQKRLALQVQQALLSDGRGMREVRASGDDRGQLSPDQRIVIADAARPPGQVHAELQ